MILLSENYTVDKYIYSQWWTVEMLFCYFWFSYLYTAYANESLQSLSAWGAVVYVGKIFVNAVAETCLLHSREAVSKYVSSFFSANNFTWITMLRLNGTLIPISLCKNLCNRQSICLLSKLRWFFSSIIIFEYAYSLLCS